jgi:hypothetical protein
MQGSTSSECNSESLAQDVKPPSPDVQEMPAAESLVAEKVTQRALRPSTGWQVGFLSCFELKYAHTACHVPCSRSSNKANHCRSILRFLARCRLRRGPRRQFLESQRRRTRLSPRAGDALDGNREHSGLLGDMLTAWHGNDCKVYYLAGFKLHATNCQTIPISS